MKTRGFEIERRLVRKGMLVACSSSHAREKERERENALGRAGGRETESEGIRGGPFHVPRISEIRSRIVLAANTLLLLLSPLEGKRNQPPRAAILYTRLPRRLSTRNESNVFRENEGKARRLPLP